MFFSVVRDGGEKRVNCLIMHIHFDYVKVVVQVICINDKLILTILDCSKEQWPEAMTCFVELLAFNSR